MMKRIILALFLLLIVILPLQVDALSVSQNNITIDKGTSKNIDLYAEVDSEITEVNFTLVYTSYDVPAYFNIESGLQDETSGIRHNITFSQPVTGKVKLGTIRVEAVNNPKVTAGSVNIHSASAKGSDGSILNLNTQMINATINKTNNTTTKPEETKPTTNTNDEENLDSNLLSKIESSLVSIELKKDVFEYTVNIKEGIEELDLKPIAIDDKYEIEISNQKISELPDKQIVIKVKNEKVTEEYKITVNIIENIDTEIDEEEFESTFKYKGKWTILIITFGIILFAGLFLIKRNK